MSFLVVIAQIFTLLAGFDTPLNKETIRDRIAEMDVCASTGCAR